MIGQFLEMVDSSTGIVGSTTGSNYYVRVLSTLNRELLRPSASVALHRHSNALVDVLPPEADSTISVVSDAERPDVKYSDIGGMDVQKQEIREAVELPLTQGDLYEQIGIDPPRGVLLYGPPGTGKTMLAKAVAHHTTAAFIRVVGSEFVQKYLGEGPRMVRDVFRLAKQNAPAIIFVDEVDAIATARFDAQTGADREVQRILMELLTQMDGFEQNTSVKVGVITRRRAARARLIQTIINLSDKPQTHPPLAAHHRPPPTTGHHGDEPRGHARPGAPPPRPPRPQDRVPAARPPPEAARLPGLHREDEPLGGGRPRGLRGAAG